MHPSPESTKDDTMLLRFASLLLLLGATATAPVLAAEPCAHSAPRNLSLDLAGVRSVVFEIGHNELRLDARAGASGEISGRACASDAGDLERLKLSQRKDGDTLVVRAWREGNGVSGLFGNRYAELRLAAQVPAHLPVRLEVGSGDAWITGVASLGFSVGSGDLDIRAVKEAIKGKVGSGDIEIDGAGSLELGSIGSGDVSARNIRGDVEVGSIGSGDFSLDRVGGRVGIGSVGSGDVELSAVAGAIEVGSIGSGDLDVRGAASLRVRSIGSGDVSHRDVRGTVDVPRRR